MLILTRRVGEALVIGRNIKISVVGVKGKLVRLGIDAPKKIPVHREEIAEAGTPEEASPDSPDRIPASADRNNK